MPHWMEIATDIAVKAGYIIWVAASFSMSPPLDSGESRANALSLSRIKSAQKVCSSYSKVFYEINNIEWNGTL